MNCWFAPAGCGKNAELRRKQTDFPTQTRRIQRCALATSRANLPVLLETVREIEPIIREHAPEAERERRLADAVAVAMRERGLYRMWRPRAFGGMEVDPVTAFRVFEEIARIDSAAAWNLQMSCAWDTFGAWFPDQGAEEIFGHPETTLGGAGFPPRRAVRVDRGYLVSGRQPFVSGGHQARWFMGLAHVFDGDQPRLWDNGDPVTLIIACPRKDP